MRVEKIILNKYKSDFYLDAYISDKIDGLERKAILVIPGGGYSCVCSDREGEPIAQAFIPYGYNAFVLHYTVDKKHPFPTQLIEVAEAIKHIKDNAEKYGIAKDKVFECMERINAARPCLPIAVGDVIMKDIFGANIVATQNAK